MIVNATGLDLGAEANNPVIGYENLLSEIAADEEDAAAGFPASNLLNPATDQIWVAESTGDQHITAMADGTFDYVGFARHNFGSGNIGVQVEGFDGEDWNVVINEIVPMNDGPLIMRFAPTAFSGMRVFLNPDAEIPQAAVMFAGRLLVLERKIYVGHRPLSHARRSNVVTGRSSGGQFLGRVSQGGFKSTTIDLQDIDPDWYREHMEPFAAAAEENPFFFAWRPQRFPLETGYCWATDDVVPDNQRPNGMMQVAFPVDGITT